MRNKSIITKCKYKICLIIYCYLFSISIVNAVESINYNGYELPKIYTYKKVVISEIYRNKEDKATFKTKGYSKIIIQPSTKKHDLAAIAQEYMAQSKISAFDNPTWEITLEQLPLSEDHCLMSYVDPCIPNSKYCYKPCFTSSPQFLAFDENRAKLYLAVSGTDEGTGGGTYFLFVADVNKKEIKFLHNEFGPLSASLSPSGKYLVIYGHNIGEIYNTLNDEEFEIGEDNIYDPPEKVQLHFVSDIKWLSDTQFTYKDSVLHDKFQHEADEITEHTVDVPTKKTVYSKTIKVNTYQYKSNNKGNS